MANKMAQIWKQEVRPLDAAEREAAEAARDEQHADEANEKRGLREEEPKQA